MCGSYIDISTTHRWAYRRSGMMRLLKVSLSLGTKVCWTTPRLVGLIIISIKLGKSNLSFTGSLDVISELDR